jgi:hypothetical protein
LVGIDIFHAKSDKKTLIDCVKLIDGDGHPISRDKML